MITEFSKLQLYIYCILVGLISFGISSLIEGYKKIIRKDKASKYEIYALSFFLSALAASGLIYVQIFVPILAFFFSSPVYFDHILLCVVMYLMQYYIDMKGLKKLIQLAAIQLISKKLPSLSKEDIAELFKD